MCDKCDYESTQETELKRHKLLVHENSRPEFKCDVCSFSDMTEENVLNHKIAKHSKHVCEMCDFECDTEQKIEDHFKTAHKQTKFTCTHCPSTFKTHAKLKEHKANQHEPQSFPCDYCGNKSASLSKLDEHIQTYHKIDKIPSSRTADFSKKSPCDFKSPNHSSSCCDRMGNPAKKIFTLEQRIENGPCRAWNENTCRYSDLCRYAHIELCRYQETCRAPFYCRFFHFNKTNFTFLGGKAYRSSFMMNPQDFPPFPPQTNNQRN